MAKSSPSSSLVELVRTASNLASTTLNTLDGYDFVDTFYEVSLKGIIIQALLCQMPVKEGSVELKSEHNPDEKGIRYIDIYLRQPPTLTQKEEIVLIELKYVSMGYLREMKKNKYVTFFNKSSDDYKKLSGTKQREFVNAKLKEWNEYFEENKDKSDEKNPLSHYGIYDLSTSPPSTKSLNKYLSENESIENQLINNFNSLTIDKKKVAKTIRIHGVFNKLFIFE